MKFVICICTYNRNLSLLRCLKSINNLYVLPNIKIEIIIVDNAIEYSSFKLVKKLKKSFKYEELFIIGVSIIYGDNFLYTFSISE